MHARRSLLCTRVQYRVGVIPLSLLARGEQLLPRVRKTGAHHSSVEYEK